MGILKMICCRGVAWTWCHHKEGEHLVFFMMIFNLTSHHVGSRVGVALANAAQTRQDVRSKTKVIMKSPRAPSLQWHHATPLWWIVFSIATTCSDNVKSHDWQNHVTRCNSVTGQTTQLCRRSCHTNTSTDCPWLPVTMSEHIQSRQAYSVT